MENSVVNSKNSDIKADTLKGTNVINGYTVTAEAAEGIAYSADLLGNTVLEGAAVRAIEGDTNLTNSGLRFMSTITPAAITAAGDGARFGTVIFRDSDYTKWKTNNADKTVAHFIAAAGDSTHKIVDINAYEGITGDKENGYTIFAALVKINAGNYNTDFGAVSYIKTADGVIVYSAFDEENNVRNIKEVAKAALDDTKTTQGYEEDGYKYNYLVTEGVYSPYTSAQRDVLNKYLGNN